MTNIERIQNYTLQDLAEWIVDLIEEGERNLTVEEWKDWLIHKSIEN